MYGSGQIGLTGSPSFHGSLITGLNYGRRELARRHTAVEQDVELTVRPVLHLWEGEVRNDEDDRGCAAPNVAGLARHIPPGGVEHLRRQIDGGYVSDVVRGAADASRERAKANTRGLGDDSIRDGTKDQAHDEDDADAQDRLAIRGALPVANGRDDPQDEGEDRIGGGADQVKSPTAKVRAQNPAKDDSDNLKAAHDDAESEGHAGGDTSLCQGSSVG